MNGKSKLAPLVPAKEMKSIQAPRDSDFVGNRPNLDVLQLPADR
jgi:hypothetical protein